MEIGITGASGLIGKPLVEVLRADGHRVVRFVREASGSAQTTAGAGPASESAQTTAGAGPASGQASDTRAWDPGSRILPASSVADLDAVIHLAGAGVADKRWTAAYKRTVLDSRVDGTTAVAAAIAEARAGGRGPSVLLSASAVGYYGDTGDRLTDETGPLGEGFLADVCRQWEAATAPAAAAGARVALLRTGIVLSGAGGLGKRLKTIFKAGLGAPLGSGHQYMSWISLHDEVQAVRHLLTADVHGPVNLVGPAPVTNRELTKVFGRVVKRPTLPIAVPGPVLKALLGQFAGEGVLVGQRLEPAVLQASGFTFAHSDLESALRASL